MVLDTADEPSMPRFHLSDSRRYIDNEIYQEMKLFLRTCDQLMRPSQARVATDQSLIPDHPHGESILTTLPPTRFMPTAVGWARYMVVTKPLVRIPVLPNTKKIRINVRFYVPGTVKLKCIVLKNDSTMAKTLIPTHVLESEDTKDELFLVSYDFELCPNTASCFLEFEPTSYERTLKELELYLTIEKEAGDLTMTPSFMEERLSNLRGHSNTLSCWRSFSRLLHVFSAAVTSALMERQGQRCQGVKAFLKEEGFPTTSEGLASLVDIISAIFWM